jgi:signal transduction histidine kinase/DNA-binding response OmpR family regulator/ligand-binding sensor domain-containing protein
MYALAGVNAPAKIMDLTERYYKCFLVVLGFIMLNLFLIPPLQAQPESYKFEHFSNEDGLSQNLVFSIIQDYRGFMWFGTLDGLNRYNGYQFNTYNHIPGDSLSLTNNAIHALFEDHNRNLWVGAVGLNLYDRKMDRFIPVVKPEQIDPDLQYFQINDISEDHNGDIWFSINGIGVFRLDLPDIDHSKGWIGNQIQNMKLAGPYPFPEKFMEQWEGVETINLLFINRTLWIAAEKEILSLEVLENGLYPEPGQHLIKKADIDLTSETGRFYDLFCDEQGLVWIGTNRALIQLSDQLKQKAIYYYSEEGLHFSADWKGLPKKITCDKSGNLWIATFEGVITFNQEKKTFQQIRYNPGHKEGLSFDNITSVFTDKGNIVWIGTAGVGIDRYIGYSKQFEHYLSKNQTNRIYSVYDLVSLSGSGLWFSALDGKLLHLDRTTGRCREIKKPDNINEWMIDDISIDHQGKMWISNDNLLLHFDPVSELAKTYVLVNRDVNEFLPSDSVHSLLTDNKDNLWLCNAHTLKRFDPDLGIMENHTFQGLELNQVNTFLCDENGVFWIATLNGLLKYHMDTEDQILYQARPEGEGYLRNANVTCILPDPKDPGLFIWMGTGGGGLHRMNKQSETFQVYDLNDGLPNNYIYGILADEKGKLWISTNKGLSCFDPEHNTFENYTSKDGIQNNEFNSRSYYKSESGEMFFGGINGISAFYPQQIEPNPNIPDVVLTDFQISYKTVTPGTEDSPLKYTISETGSIDLDYKQRNIAFSFAAMDFTNPDKNQFRYKLEGFNDDWIDARTENHATYTNLPHGHYVFRVQGSNNDGIYNESGTSIRVHIARPLWKKWWAYLLYTIIAGLAGFAMFRYFNEKRRMQRIILEEQLKAEQIAVLEKIKSQFFANISHEFRTPINLIRGRVEEMLDQVKRYDFREKMISIDQNAGELLEFVEEILDLTRLESKNITLNLKSGDLILFLRKLVQSFQPLAITRNIALEFNSDQETLIVEFDAFAMKRIVSNLISNALKFTPGSGKVQVYITKPAATKKINLLPSEQIIQIRVVDNGKGIPENEHESIFKRYYQVENNEEALTGFGLGLALVKGLVDLLGGDIRVESKEKVGSAFIVELPVVASDKFTETHSVQKVSPANENTIKLPAKDSGSVLGSDRLMQASSSKLVLVVEDHKELQEYIRAILIPEYRVLLADHGKQGLELAFKETPDLIISDVKMPEMDGFEMTGQLTTDHRTSHIPVILLTAKAEDTDRLTGLELGADDYLVKPFKKEELFSRIRNILRKREVLTKKNSGRIMEDFAFEELKSIDQEFLQKVNKIVEENMEDEQFGIERLAREAGMSSSNLYRKVQALLDITPVQLLQELRFKRAILYLKKGYNISEVAGRVGFKNQANFSTSFKKKFGCSPREYIKEH